MWFQLISMIGAAMILVAYAGHQRNRLGREDVSYNLLNLVGSALLAWVAVIDRRVGFIVLEGAWALLSIQPLIVAMQRRR
jgi:hypothetical protein